MQPPDSGPAQAPIPQPAAAPAPAAGASWPGILANIFTTLWAIGGTVLWSAFSFITTALGSKYTDGPNKDLVHFFFWLGAPPLLAAFVLSLVGFVAGVNGNARRSLGCALGSFFATLVPALVLIGGFVILSG